MVISQGISPLCPFPRFKLKSQVRWTQPTRVHLEIGANLIAHIASTSHAVRTGDDEIYLFDPGGGGLQGLPKTPRALGIQSP